MLHFDGSNLTVAFSKKSYLFISSIRLDNNPEFPTQFFQISSIQSILCR